MSKVVISEENLQAIANSIRSKAGVQTKYYPSVMDDAIDALQLSGTGGNVVYFTTEEWNSMRDYIPPQGTICVYTDFKVVDNVAYPNIKIADGTSYIIDQPFVAQSVMDDLQEHMDNTAIHVTTEEKNFWNNKVRCYNNGETLIFTTN